MDIRKQPGYRNWMAIIQRCTNPHRSNFPLYGGRGITICKEWAKSPSAFLAYVGQRPSPGHTIDRIDNDGNYEPGNVRWATSVEQSRNKRSNRWIEFNGRRMILADWAREASLTKDIIVWRLNHGRPIEEALTIPRYPRGLYPRDGKRSASLG
jgi:hypothetical protein